MQDPLALDRQVCFALAAASRSVIGLYRPVLEPLGLTHPQYLVMLALWERSPRRVRDLSDDLRLEPATLSPLLKRLESAGLLQRLRDADDERALKVTLTEKGRALRAEAEAVPLQIIERLGMTVEELEAMRDGLLTLLAATERPLAGIGTSGIPSKL
jgi:DNA-binding MarR family transcriptional regulator